MDRAGADGPRRTSQDRRMSRHSLQWIACAAALTAALTPPLSAAGSLQIKLTDARDHNAAGLAVVVETTTPEAPPSIPPKAVMDQRREQFVPRVLIVRRG